KLICPGLASSRTITATHKLAFDCAQKARRAGVEVGRLSGNPVHEAFTKVVDKCPPSFSINTIVNETGEVTDLYCGDWRESHEKACAAYSARHSVAISEKREIVVVSSGGFPNDLNLIQAHKALEMASKACVNGGTIVFLAECPDGLGREDFLSWFEVASIDQMASNLCEKYQVNGQTAWSLLEKAERYKINIVTELSKEISNKMRMEKIGNIEEALHEISSKTGYIIPFGSRFNII
ncbi:MAG: hypothetical protein HKN25_16100, partial [Pyrinomonadaceae bacterium]|nr:hypothetical protein [Pyrinomonadaceae bacterium]